MRRISLGCAVLVFMLASIAVFPAEDIDYVMMVQDYTKATAESNKPQTPRRVADQFQKYILKTVFLKDMFSRDSIFKPNVDEDDDDYIISSQPSSSPVYDSIMLDTLASQLADQDALKLRKILMKRQGVSPDKKD